MIIRELKLKYGQRREIPGELIMSSASVNEYISKLGWHDEAEEHMWTILLNIRNEVIGHSLIAKGGVSGMGFDLASLLRIALLANASKLFLVHNHPSGKTSPSGEDDRMTKGTMEAAALVGLEVLDHLIIGCDLSQGYYSYSDEGKL